MKFVAGMVERDSGEMLWRGHEVPLPFPKAKTWAHRRSTSSIHAGSRGQIVDQLLPGGRELLNAPFRLQREPMFRR